MAGFIWGNSLVKDPALPSFEDYAYIKTESTVQPKHTAIPAISANMPELVFCGCKSQNAKCKPPCKCASADPPQKCTTLCACRGTCVPK